MVRQSKQVYFLHRTNELEYLDRSVLRECVARAGQFELLAAPGVAVESAAHKMSKSRGNVVNPNTVIDEFGADSLRLYIMFMGPVDAVKPWDTSRVSGVHRCALHVSRCCNGSLRDSRLS